MDHLENRKIDGLTDLLSVVLINQVNTTTVLDLVQKELEETTKYRLTRAKNCGWADDCLGCFQLARCVRRKVEKKVLGIAQWGGESE